MLYKIIQANGGLPDRAKVVFANTGREMPQTLDFIQRCASEWDVTIDWVERCGASGGSAIENSRYRLVSHKSASRDGEPFAEMIKDRGYLPNMGAPYCTQQLKLRPTADYLKALGWNDWTAAIGIRADEPRRLADKPHAERWDRWYPLANAGVSKSDVLAFWKAQPFDLELPVDEKGDAWLGNCDGCWKKSEAKLARLARQYPRRAEWWERMESLARDIGSRTTGVQFRLGYTRRELRIFEMRRGLSDGSTDIYCQADGGECVV